MITLKFTTLGEFQDTSTYYSVYTLPTSFRVQGSTRNTGMQVSIDTERAKKEFAKPFEVLNDYNSYHDFYKHQYEYLNIKNIKLSGNLRKGAKSTDLMRHENLIWGCTFVISAQIKKCLDLVEDKQRWFSLYPTDIGGIEYYSMYIPIINMNVVNYKKSKFVHHKRGESTETLIEDIDEYNKVDDLRGDLVCTQLCLPLAYKHIPIFSCQIFVQTFFVSQPIMECLMSKKLSNIGYDDNIKILFDDNIA